MMNKPASFFIDKKTGTPADTLLAFGVTDFLDHLIPEGAGDVGMCIEDLGDCYGISQNTSISADWIEQADFFAMIPGLNTRTKKVAAPYTIEYLDEQQRNNTYFLGRKNNLVDDQLSEQGIYPPNPDWPVWAIINQMSATTAYNKLVDLWQSHEICFPKLAAIILQMFSERPNQVTTAMSAWRQLVKQQGIQGSATIAQLQVVNPGMGKGFNGTKADRLTSAGGLSGFWLLEYLKFSGLYRAAIPRVVRDEKDRKTYVLKPNRLSWRTHKNVFPEFQRSLYAQTAVKMDILANLTYCRTFLTQWQNAQGGLRAWQRANPGNHIAAVETIYYKHLGKAHATLNLSSLSLPEWLGKNIATKEEAQAFLDLIDEHNYVIYRLDEDGKKNNGYNLLRQYRHFLSSRDLDTFFQFMGDYSTHLTSELAQGNNPPHFSTTGLEVLIMAHDKDKKLTTIVENEGFRNIAEAIRRSTVIPQYQKAHGRESLYEIRYGLGSKLLRNAQYNETFIQELSQFMHDYNRENSRKLETRDQQYRSNITVDDIEAIVSLIDKYNAPTVASLLVAFGYARDPRLGKKTEENSVVPETQID